MNERDRPFAAVRRALQDISVESSATVGRDEESDRLDSPSMRLDTGRWRRTGVPEVVLGERKTPDQLAEALSRVATATGRALASRCAPAQMAAVAAALAPSFEVVLDEVARTIVVARHGVVPPVSGGRVGVISAGTSDLPAASEASLIAREMGAVVTRAWDVGVAGLHRLVEPLERMVVEERVDVIVVAAGMDGALPSVVAGLVPVPVIGLPTSVGYGLGGEGVAALLAMLQTCAPGLTVVNVDNGIGAGATAALIANRVAEARERADDGGADRG